MRRLAICFAVLGSAVLLPAGSARGHGSETAGVAQSGTAEVPVVGALAGEEAVFWDGPFIESGSVTSAAACASSPGACPTFKLVLKESGERLRVAIDTPSREDGFVFDLIDPAGAVKASESNSNQFNAEAFVTKPAAGEWTIQVRPRQVNKAAFRMRARLEKTIAPKPTGKVALLPNLRTVPPLEFTFVAPLNPLNGLYPPDTVNPPADVAGVHPLSCTADEMAPKEVGGFAAQRCLRLTSGPINLGPGPYDMRFDLADDLVEGTADPIILRGPMVQRVYFADGSTEDRASGTYTFHTTHGHFHDDNILTYELYSVVAPGGKVELPDRRAVTVDTSAAKPTPAALSRSQRAAIQRSCSRSIKRGRRLAARRRACVKRRERVALERLARSRASQTRTVAPAAVGAPQLVPAGVGTKSGFCPADQLFGEWRSFAQAAGGTFGEGDTPLGSCFSPTDGVLGLSVGWGDVYRWQRPGQYVEFAGNGDGVYLVRTIVDKSDEVLETDETDNTAYALIRIVGESIDIIERGQGDHPWMETATVFAGAGPASRD